MKILIGSPVRQDEGIFIEYLKSLDNLIIPHNAQVDKFFILNDCEHLSKHLQPNEYVIENTGDEYICTEETHTWNPDNLSKMECLRNTILYKAKNECYDYLFMVDSDLILEPATLITLLASGKDLISEIFWTASDPEGKKGFWPNCWQYDQCSSDPGAIQNWLAPGVYQIGGTGACFLIDTKVIKAGVNYSRIPNIKNALWGEDRWFCIRAYCTGFSIWVDTHCPATHLYRPSLYKRYMDMTYGGESIG